MQGWKKILPSLHFLYMRSLTRIYKVGLTGGYMVNSAASIRSYAVYMPYMYGSTNFYIAF